LKRLGHASQVTSTNGLEVAAPSTSEATLGLVWRLTRAVLEKATLGLRLEIIASPHGSGALGLEKRLRG
jgi:hypothetical protein